MNRKGFFLTDALIAVAILIIMSSLLFLEFPSPEDAVVLDQANALTGFLGGVRVGTCCAQMFPGLDERFTLLQALAFDASSGNLTRARSLAGLLADEELLPQEYGYSIYYRNGSSPKAGCIVLASAVESVCDEEDLPATVAAKARKRVWYYVLNETSGELVDPGEPVVVEVKVWVQ